MGSKAHDHCIVFHCRVKNPKHVIDWNVFMTHAVCMCMHTRCKSVSCYVEHTCARTHTHMHIHTVHMHTHAAEHTHAYIHISHVLFICFISVSYFLSTAFFKTFNSCTVAFWHFGVKRLHILLDGGHMTCFIIQSVPLAHCLM